MKNKKHSHYNPVQSYKTRIDRWNSESYGGKLPKTSDHMYAILFSVFMIATLAMFSYRSYVFGTTTVANYIQEKTEVLAQEPETPVEIIKYVEAEDYRVQKLKTYLESKESPLTPYADYIIEQSDLNAIDWTMIVSISRMESDHCKKTMPNSHNCWGLGGSNFMYFDSYEDSIKFTAELLNKHYRYNMNQAIKAKYCPSSDGCNPQWSNVVADTTAQILN